MTTQELTKLIIQQKFSSSEEDLLLIKDSFLTSTNFYLASAPDITQEDLEQKQFIAYIDEDESLIAFLTEDEARKFVFRYGKIIDGTPVIANVNRDDFSRIIALYCKNQYIKQIKIYAIAPAYMIFQPDDFLLEKHKPKEKEPEIEFIGVDLVKKILNTYDKSDRVKLDKSGRTDDIHTLIQDLMRQNQMDPAELDKKLGLPNNYTKSIFFDVSNNNLSIDIMLKYLSYFGLQQYLYCFKNNSFELARKLKSNSEIDIYYIKSSNAKGRYILEMVEQMTDSEGYYVYKITFRNKDTEEAFETIVSNAVGLKLKKCYQIQNQNGENISEEIQEPEQKEERTYEEQRKDAVIRYFRIKGENTRAAEEKYKTLESEPDILDAFYCYVEKKKGKKLEIQGYTPQKLIKNLHYSPYEAFMMLIRLKNDPQNTKQILKYRETDPQYQRSGKGEK